MRYMIYAIIMNLAKSNLQEVTIPVTLLLVRLLADACDLAC